MFTRCLVKAHRADGGVMQASASVLVSVKL